MELWRSAGEILSTEKKLKKHRQMPSDRCICDSQCDRGAAFDCAAEIDRNAALGDAKILGVAYQRAVYFKMSFEIAVSRILT